MKKFIILMPCFTHPGAASQSPVRPVNKAEQVGIRHMRLTVSSLVQQYNDRRKDGSVPKLVFRPTFGEDLLSGLEKKIPANNRLLVIPVAYIPKQKTLAPFSSKPEHARFNLAIPAPGIQFGAKICGMRERVRVGTFARQIVQWAAYLANAGEKSQLPWKLDAPLHLDEYYISEPELKQRRKKNTAASASQAQRERPKHRRLKVDHMVD